MVSDPTLSGVLRMTAWGKEGWDMLNSDTARPAGHAHAMSAARVAYIESGCQGAATACQAKAHLTLTRPKLLMLHASVPTKEEERAARDA